MMRLVALVGMMLVVSNQGSAEEQSVVERRQSINDPVVSVMGAGVNGQMTHMLSDIAAVTKGDDLRVLQIIGQGSLHNITDLLFLKGVDAAMIQSDALNFYDQLGLEDSISSKVVYIAPLGKQDAHLLARRDSATTIDDLDGKRINFGRTTSGTVISASLIFDALGIKAEVSNHGHKKALSLLEDGELDAMFWMTPQPAELLTRLDPESGLHFLAIPADRVDQDIYPPSVIAGDNYAVAGADIETVSTLTVLAAYNWEEGSPRRPKVQMFADSLRSLSLIHI